MNVIHESSKTPAFFILLFVLLGTMIILITPYGEFGDEETHWNYTKHIQSQHRLPPMSFDVREMRIPEAFQPPLYYMIGALFLSLPIDQPTSVYVLRFFSLMLATGALYLAWKSAVLISSDRSLAILGTAFVAFNPQFLYVNCGITSISMMALTGSLTIFLMLRMLSTKGNLSQRAAILGVCFGATMLSRSITIFLFPLCVGTILVAAKDENPAYKGLLKYFILFSISAFAVAGWWYIRNWISYGDPFAWKLYQATVGFGWVRREPFDWFYIVKTFAWLHAYFWVYFGRQQYHAGILDYSIYLLLQALSVVGLWEIFKSSEKDPSFRAPTWNNRGFVLLTLTTLTALLQTLALQWRITSPQGRYLYTAIIAICIPLAAGLIKILPPQFRFLGSRLIAVFLFMMCVYLLLRYWLPHFV